MFHVFVPPDAIAASLVTITSPETLHHLSRVLRVRVGDQLECCDGDGHVYAGPVASVSASALTMTIERQWQEARPVVLLTLAQALIKPAHFEWVLQKATELGVERIIPLVTARTTSRLVNASEDSQRLKRWRTIVQGAAAQSERSRLPSVSAPQPFDVVIDGFGQSPVLLLTPAEGTQRLTELGADTLAHPELVVMIGPEGDFSPEEIAYAKARGAHLVGLGRRPLRAETAAVAVLAILQHRLGVL